MSNSIQIGSITIGDTLLNYKTYYKNNYIITYIEDYEEYLNDILNKIYAKSQANPKNQLIGEPVRFQF
jgi:hypothetical protein